MTNSPFIYGPTGALNLQHDAQTQSITGDTQFGTGSLHINAGGTNQNIILTPSGPLGSAGGFTIINGQMGIGTSTPAATLDVNGTINGSGALTLFSSAVNMFQDGSANTWFTLTSPSQSANFSLQGSGGNNWLLSGGGPGWGGSFIVYDQTTSMPIMNVTAGDDIGLNGSLVGMGPVSTFMIQHSTGNVGIGTITPANPLSVVGIVQSTTGGFKFPDGTVQTTAASGGYTNTAVGKAVLEAPSGIQLLVANESITVNFPQVIQDTGGNYSPGTGIWTCRTTGTYLFSAHVFIGATFAIGNLQQIFLYQNVTVVDAQANVAAVSGSLYGVPLDLTSVVSCVAGDQIFINVQSASASPFVLNSRASFNWTRVL